MAGESSQPNGKVSTTEFYKELKEFRKEVHDMELRILTKIDEKLNGCPSRDEFDKLYEDFDNHKSRTTIWEGINSFGIVIATIIGAIFGQKQ